MTGAMYAAVAGLKAHMSALNVIGQNISNVNTNAYKATRYTFLEALYTTVRGGSNGSNQVGGRNPAQNGYGSSIGTIDLDMSTKNYTPTGMATDVMIDGDGFLIVGDKTSTFSSMDDLKDMYLTRLGNLEFDNQGYLVDGQGQVVYGFLSVENPVYRKALYNDDGSEKTLEHLPLKPANPGDPTPLPQDGQFYIDENDQLVQAKLTGTAPNQKVELKIIEQYTPSPVLTAIRLPMAYADGVTGHKKGDAVYPTYDDDENSATYGQIVDASGTDVSGRISRDSVSIDENTGRITCTTATGEAVVIGSIAIAKVDNPNGVTHVDGHYYQALDGAGDVRLTSIGNSVLNTTDPNSPFYEPPANAGDPVEMKEGEISILSSGGTKLISGGLESSGTDLASEISNMIMIQRGYQANTRIVTVTDSMLEELVNMKR